MNIKLPKANFKLTLLFFVSALAALSACQSEADRIASETQIAANIYGTQTAQAPTYTPTPTITPTPSPTPTETATPTPTHTPTPMYSAVTLTLDDLPPGYENFSEEELDEFFSEFNEFDLHGKFGFANNREYIFLLGFSAQIPNVTDQMGFDLAMGVVGEMFADLFAAGYGYEGDVDVEEIFGEELGEVSSHYLISMSESGINLTLELIGFRYDEVGILIMGVSAGDGFGEISLSELAEILLQRLLDISSQQ